MRYQLEYGDTADAQIDGYERAGKPVPDYLYPPILLPGLVEVVDLFWRLSTDRQYGMSIGPIPQQAIDNALARRELQSEEMINFYNDCIRVMDSEYLAYYREQLENDNSDNPKKESKEVLNANVFDSLF